jgi:hypothetical protein
MPADIPVEGTPTETVKKEVDKELKSESGNAVLTPVK